MKKDIFTQALHAAEQKGFALKSKQSISFFNNYANKYLYSEDVKHFCFNLYFV